jgi:hypothetical protein
MMTTFSIRTRNVISVPAIGKPANQISCGIGGQDVGHDSGMKRLICISALLVTVLLTSPGTRADQVDNYLMSQMQHHRIPGLTHRLVIVISG